MAISGMYLEVESGWEPGRRVALVGERTLLGRANHCDVVIGSTSVSREHARVEAIDGEGLHVSDLGSSNGTKVNGALVLRAPLNPGDTVQLGEVVFRVGCDA